MAYALFDMNNLPHSRCIVRKFPSYADAVAHAKLAYEIVVFAEDTDIDYRAADFFTKQGRIYAIEPINKAAQ